MESQCTVLALLSKRAIGSWFVHSSVEMWVLVPPLRQAPPTVNAHVQEDGDEDVDRGADEQTCLPVHLLTAVLLGFQISCLSVVVSGFELELLCVAVLRDLLSDCI